MIYKAENSSVTVQLPRYTPTNLKGLGPTTGFCFLWASLKKTKNPSQVPVELNPLVISNRTPAFSPELSLQCAKALSYLALNLCLMASTDFKLMI